MALNFGARRPAAPVATHGLGELTTLEDRLTPALSFQFDYRYDTAGLFTDPSHRAALEETGRLLASRITTPLSAIAPGGNNTWDEVFDNPATGQQTKVTNASVPADTVVVYVGGIVATGREAGEGGPGGYNVSGGPAWQKTVSGRGAGGFGPWGGSVSFDTATHWYYGSDPAGAGKSGLDFRSVAIHELTHVLGFGTSDQWSNLIQNGVFTGPHVSALAGTVKVSPDQQHFAQGNTSNGSPVSMQPVLDSSRRVLTSELDYAGLADLGWTVDPAAGGVAVSTPVAVSPPVVAGPSIDTPVVAAQTIQQAGGSSAELAGSPASRVVAVSGPSDGTVQLYKSDAGALTPLGTVFQPFGDFGGAVRTAVADVNGDGAADIVLGTGPGGGSRVRVLDGRTFQDLVPEYVAFESTYNGGVFLAAGDFDRDGRAEIVVTPDQGGGARVQVLSVAGGQVQKRADFFGINDPNFRGGARTAVGDLNGDGTPDLIVAAGFGGGPRVSILDGRSVLSGGGVNLTADFFAFDPSLRNGVYLAAGDIDHDGYAELVFGAGPGGGPRVLSLSGKTLTQAGPQAALAAPQANFFAGDADQRGGVRVSLKDTANNGQLNLVTGAGLGGLIQTFAANEGMRPVGTTIPFTTSELDGVYVG